MAGTTTSALLHHVDGRRGGSAPGTIHGETDDFSYNIVKDPVHIHDFHATISSPARDGPRLSRFTYQRTRASTNG